MAWYDITYACGHTGSVQLYGAGKDRDYRKRMMEGDFCPECAARRRAERAAAAGAEAEKRGFAPLRGSEKQIAWAELIRERFVEFAESKLEEEVADIAKDISRHPEKEKEMLAIKDSGLEIFHVGFTHITTKIFSASWWIDNRDTAPFKLIEREYKKIADGAVAAPSRSVADDAAARAEATVAPEEQKHAGAVEISGVDDVVTLRYVLNEDFRTIVKAAGFSWNKERKAWERKITKFSGNIQDRVADIGNELLRAGFAIVIFDSELRSRAVNADFVPECKHWVSYRTSGKYEGCLSISFPRDDKSAEQARRIKGSAWDKGTVVVPISQCDEVFDFAYCNGYKISDGASAAAAAFKENLWCATPKTPAKVIVEKHDPADILNSSRDILPDLLDQ